MLLSVIIVSYNTAKLTLNSVESVITDAQDSKLLNSKTEIIVVDNNSRDNSVAELKKIAKNSPLPIRVLPQRKNLGFGRANNLAIEEAKGKYLFFLNSDATVEAGTLEKLVRAFTDNPIHETTAQDRSSSDTDRLGMVAAKLLNTDKSDQYQGGDTPTLVSLAGQQLLLDDIPLLGSFFPSTQHTGKRGAQTNQGTTPLVSKGWVAATAVVVRRELIDEIGGFDPAIFMYGEDMEWSLRARTHHWDVVIHQNAPVVHLGSASSSSKNALIGEAKAYVYIWAKHYPTWQMPLVQLILKLGALLRWVIFGTMGQRERSRIYKELFITDAINP